MIPSDQAAKVVYGSRALELIKAKTKQTKILDLEYKCL